MNKQRAVLIGSLLALAILAASVVADPTVPANQPSAHIDQTVVTVLGDTPAYLFARATDNALVGTPINLSFVFAPKNGFQSANDVWLSYRLDENTVGGLSGSYIDFTVKITVNNFSYFKFGATRAGENYGTMYSDHIAESAAFIHLGINNMSFQDINHVLESTGNLYGEFHVSQISLIIQYSYFA